MVSMARPFLADAELHQKRNRDEPMRSTLVLAATRLSRSDLRWQSHLVPGESSRLHETKMPILPAVQKKNLAVVVRDLLGWRLPLTRRRVGIR